MKQGKLNVKCLFKPTSRIYWSSLANHLSDISVTFFKYLTVDFTICFYFIKTCKYI